MLLSKVTYKVNVSESAVTAELNKCIRKHNPHLRKTTLQRDSLF